MQSPLKSLEMMSIEAFLSRFLIHTETKKGQSIVAMIFKLVTLNLGQHV